MRFASDRVWMSGWPEREYNLWLANRGTPPGMLEWQVAYQKAAASFHVEAYRRRNSARGRQWALDDAVSLQEVSRLWSAKARMDPRDAKKVEAQEVSRKAYKRARFQILCIWLADTLLLAKRETLRAIVAQRRAADKSAEARDQ